eukprot:5643314-Prymnesium_polylepis.2
MPRGRARVVRRQPAVPAVPVELHMSLHAHVHVQSSTVDWAPGGAHNAILKVSAGQSSRTGSASLPTSHAHYGPTAPLPPAPEAFGAAPGRRVRMMSQALRARRRLSQSRAGRRRGRRARRARTTRGERRSPSAGCRCRVARGAAACAALGRRRR